MSAVADRYRRLSDAFAATIAAVPAAAWDNRTPCEDWTARDLAAHMVDTQRMFLGFIGEALPELPDPRDEPGPAWDGARRRVQEVLDDPARATTTFSGMLGESTFEAAVDRFLCTDLVIHGWDLAEATGQPLRLDPGDMAAVRESMAPLAATMRGPRAFGPEIEPPPGADEQTRFLAYFGRRSK